MTSAGNVARTDIACGFGCRKELEREKTNERGRRHYGTAKGRTNKCARNRKRSLKPSGSAKSKRAIAAPKMAISPFTPGVFLYIAHLLSLASGCKPPLHEIAEFLNEVIIAAMDRARCTILRQRSLPERGG